MESAPQSTITHNTVIEFASDLESTPRHPRERGRRIKRRPSLPKRAASNRRDLAKIVSSAQRRGSQKPSIFERKLPGKASSDGREHALCSAPAGSGPIMASAANGLKMQKPAHPQGRARAP